MYLTAVLLNHVPGIESLKVLDEYFKWINARKPGQNKIRTFLNFSMRKNTLYLLIVI